MQSRQKSATPGGSNPGAAPNARQSGVALSGTLFDLEARMVSVVLRETLQRQREFTTLANALFRLYAWPFVHSGHTQEMQDIGRRSFELALSTQTAVFQSLLGSLTSPGSLTLPGEPASDKPVSGRRVKPERRVSALVIPFPERRVIDP